MLDWIEKMKREQAALNLMDEPAFTMEDVEKKMKKVTDFAKKIFGKKKPKEKKEKKVEKPVDDDAADGEEKKKEDDAEGSNNTTN